MAKPTTGRVGRPEPPEPDPDQMAVNTLMTSVFTGVFLVVATVYFGTVGYAGLAVGQDLAGSTGARVGFGVGLAVGLLIAALALRRYRASIRARSRNLLRGIVIGGLVALGIMVLMAYFPNVAFPRYCPPGAICEGGQS
jgi:hypothetical protein